MAKAKKFFKQSIVIALIALGFILLCADSEDMGRLLLSKAVGIAMMVGGNLLYRRWDKQYSI